MSSADPNDDGFASRGPCPFHTAATIIGVHVVPFVSVSSGETRELADDVREIFAELAAT